MGTSVEGASAEPELYKRAEAYRMLGERVDGNDLLAVREVAGRLLQRAREERKPALLETLTYRYRGHSVADAGKVYRSKDEVESWRERDPITRFAARLEEQGILARRRPGRDAQGGLERGRRGDPRGRLGSGARRLPRWPTTSTPTPTPTEQFARMRVAGPFGEREGTESWRT